MRKIFKSSMKKGKYYTADGIKEVFDPYYEKFCSVEFLSKEEQYLLNKQKEIAMSTNYIDRSHDEEIIDIVRSVMNNGTGKDRKSTRLNSSHIPLSRMPSSA